MTQDETYKAWLEAAGPEKKRLETQLIELMTAHGNAVCWMQMRDKRPDLVNDAVWKALSGIDKFRANAKFSTWFHQILLNTFTDEKRRQYARREQSLEEWTEGEAQHPAGAIEARIDVDKLAALLDPEDAEFLRDRAAGLNEHELALKYHLSGGGVRNRWFLIRRQLRSLNTGALFADTTPRTSKL